MIYHEIYHNVIYHVIYHTMIYHILLWYIPLTEKFEQGHLRRQHSVVQHGKIVVTDLKHLQLSRRCFTCVQKVYYCSGLVSLHLVHNATHVAGGGGVEYISTSRTFIHVEKLLPDRVSAFHARLSLVPAQNSQRLLFDLRNENRSQE